MSVISLFMGKNSLFLPNHFNKFIPKNLLDFFKVGGLNTIFGFFLFSLVSLSNLDTWLVLLFSQVGGLIFNFYTFGNFVFNASDLNRFPRFVLFNFIIYLLFLSSLSFLDSYFTNRIVALAIAIIPISLINYFILSRLVFNKL